MTFTNASVRICIYSERPTARECIDHVWIQKGAAPRSAPHHVKPIATTRLVDFIERRSHQVNNTHLGFLKLFLSLSSNRTKNSQLLKLWLNIKSATL